MFFRVDIIDDPEAPKMVAIFELPGLVNKEISVTIKDGYLIIHGNRQSPYGDSATEQRSCPSNLNIDPESCRRASMSIRELRFGPFLRRVKIPYGTKVSIYSVSPTSHRLNQSLDIRCHSITCRGNVASYVAKVICDTN